MQTAQTNIDERTDALLELMATVYVENILRNEQNTTKKTEYTRRPMQAGVIGIGNNNSSLESKNKRVGRTLWQPMEKS